MSNQPSERRWYLHRNGETGGPYGEHAIIGWIKNGMREAVVRSETADPTSPWLPLTSHAPFAAAILPEATPSPEGKTSPSSIRKALLGVVLLTIVAVAIYLWLRASMGEHGVEAAFATAVRAPIDVENEIVSVPAQHFRSIPIQLPYSGQLTLDVNVVKGAHVNVYVLDAADWSEFERAAKSFFGGKVHSYSAFQSTQTTHARTSGPLGEGAYYIVLENPTFGLLVAPSFDVEVKGRLQP